MECDERFYVSLSCKFDKIVPDVLLDESNAVGLDYKSDGLFVSSDGELSGMPHYFRRAQYLLKQKQKRLSRTKPGSKNHEKARVKFARAASKVAACRKDFLEKKSKEISEEYDIVAVEDIDMRSISRSLKLGKATMDNGFGMFRSMLEYKLADRGKAFVKVGRFFASSQICHNCGKKDPITKDLSVRDWICPACGCHNDRDLNAALNIRDEGIRILKDNRAGIARIKACGEDNDVPLVSVSAHAGAPLNQEAAASNRISD
jgi:putative transposase